MDQQDSHYARARASLRETLSRYTNRLRQTDQTIVPHQQSAGQVTWQATIQHHLDSLSSTLTKLEQRVIRIAAFGLVSRGKSAVLNALLNRRVLQTGPLHGVTQFPHSVRWTAVDSDKVQVELIDTPGLDEIDGQARAAVARQIAQQADLILFVVSGDITRTEYRALQELRQMQTPIVVVFNKIDLYPECDRQAIYRQLQQLAARDEAQTPVALRDIVLVSADPAPVQVRVELPDGSVRYEWETPAPRIEALKQAILDILNREGRSLLALNALRQARLTETAIAQQAMDYWDAEAEQLIWQFTRYKALAVALNPIAVVDLLGGAISDLAMIRALAKLYGLPITSYQAGTLLKTILLSAGGVLLSELGSGLLLGLGKSAAAVTTTIDSATGATAYVGAAIAQASLAGFGAYRVGQATKHYLQQGCTWGPQGSDTVLQELLNQVEPETTLNRLRQEILQTIVPPKSPKPGAR